MRMFSVLALLAGIAGLVLPAPAFPRAAGEPVRLVWSEGDVAGMAAIHGPRGGEPIGFVEYHQTRTNDRLSSVRVARFRDGSSDEDRADARIAEKLEAISGRSIIRDTSGRAIVDISIDVAGGRIRATWGREGDRHVVDEAVTLPAGTYWGPLIFILLKNFDANAENGRLVFRTVAPTPKPMVLDMELSRDDNEVTLERTGVRLVAKRFRLRPTIHWMIDPLVRLIAPRATFWMLPGDPPALARFVGPRNYGRQEVVIE
jgi:hypothetical protein